MITLNCDGCDEFWRDKLSLDNFVDWQREELILPPGWFEFNGSLYCPNHILIESPAKKKVVDKAWKPEGGEDD